MSIGCVKCRGNWNLGCTPASSVAQQHRQTQAETHTRTRTFSQFGEDSGKKGRSHWHICSGHSFIQYIAYFRIRSSAGSDRWNFYITWDGLVLIWVSLIPPNTQTHTHTHTLSKQLEEGEYSSKSNWLHLERWSVSCLCCRSQSAGRRSSLFWLTWGHSQRVSDHHGPQALGFAC